MLKGHFFIGCGITYMGNLKHYVDSIRKGDNYFDEAFKLSFILREISLLHLLFGVLFFIIGSYVLGVYETAIFILYNCLVLLVKKHKFKLLIFATAFEVVFHGFICTAFVGFDAGFNLYFFTMIPGVFYTIMAWNVYAKKEITAILYTMFFVVSMVLVFVYSRIVNPFMSIGSIWTDVLFGLNILMSMICMLEFLMLLGWDILSRSETILRKNDELDKMANMDPLTMLYNRRYIDGILKEKYESLNENGNIFGVIIGDIDDFKKVNDTFGHDAGDDVLVCVADILKKSVRDNDYVCRWGGEEFLVIIAGNKQITTDVAERMRKSIMNEKIKIGKIDISVTMTFGVTESIPGYNVEKLITIADDNLYKGKKNGKNQVVS